MQLVKRLTDQPELLWCLEHRIIRRAELRRCGGKLAIAEALAACGMNDAPIIGLAFRSRNTPLLGGGARQHLPRTRPDLTELVPKGADAVASPGCLLIGLLGIAIFRIHRSRDH
ncbi:MAG: hypothetical protein VX399_00915, partial [SAR324 cluster bacterium]|nr:hypothetical protein [SAR324 cluster bacterium]